MPNNYKELKTTCQKCGKNIEIIYNRDECRIYERRIKTARDRDHQAFNKNTILYPHGCKDACLFPDSEDCCNYNNGGCRIEHCIDEVYYDDN